MEQSAAVLQAPGHGRRLETSQSAQASPRGCFSQSDSSTPRRQYRVKVPMRIVESAFYSDAALSVYMKVKALCRRPEGCTASTATLARYLRLSTSTVERGLAQLRHPAPDGVVELAESTRRSLPGGYGTTARRRVRAMTSAERFVWLPLNASEELRPRLLRALAVISHAVIRNIPLTIGELAARLRHHSGRQAGSPITVGAASRIVNALEAARWIVVDRRAGPQGRHHFRLPDRAWPLPREGSETGVGTAAESVGTRGSRPTVDEGSGSATGDGSLAFKEDHRIDRPDDGGTPCSPAVGEPPSTAPTRKGVRATGGMSAVPSSGTPAAPAPARPAQDGADTTPLASVRLPGHSRVGYHGPRLTYSHRVHDILEPVRWLLPRTNVYVQRLIGREIGSQLRQGTEAGRLRARLTTRLAQIIVEDIRDPGRWLLGVALPRWGCADPDCESGVLWSSGMRCRACAEAAADRRATTVRAAPERARAPEPHGDLRASPRAPEHRAPAPARETCPACERPYRAGGKGLCADCRPSPLPADPVAAVHPQCRGTGPGGCGRPTATGMCWRCRLSRGPSAARSAHRPGGGFAPSVVTAPTGRSGTTG